MYRECEYCGKQVHVYDDKGHRLTKINTKFCRDECRDKYWAEVRKIHRAFERASAAIGVLNSFCTSDSGGVRQTANGHLVRLLADVRENDLDGEQSSEPQGYGVLSKAKFWECQTPECGQRTFTNPAGHNCSYCGQNNWSRV